jgi:hypothetical protein
MKLHKSNSRLAATAFLLAALGLVNFTNAQTSGKRSPKKAASGPAPNIVATSPAVGATDVDPGLKEITVTFDQDMGGGMSWTGGGEQFPKMPEGQKPQWRDKRTCVLPVLLEPGHAYRVGINSSSFRNFHTVAGVPAEPTAIYFTTQGASGDQKKQMTAPKIVATSPKVGAKDVDPGVTEITVTFDQDMGGGMSWTGGGPEFPPIPEGQKAQWRDKRTCVLPVKLQAGHRYRVGINAPSYQNFSSDLGVAAKPSAIFFTTQGASGAGDSKPQGASAATESKTQSPKIVKLDPPKGAQDVDPGLKELRVTFDVPMGGGFSWCGDGPQFPKLQEGKRPSWIDGGKTCVLPVKLESGVEYEIGLNSETHKNFKSADGVPLVPVLYTFKTSGK